MAGRIRTIKPELLEDEKTSALSCREWRLFVSSLLLADDYGNFRAVEKYLDGQIFWADGETEISDVSRALKRLGTVGLLSFYTVNGQKYAHINGWNKHQRIDKPGKSRVPPPEENDSRIIPESFANDSRTVPEPFAPDPDHDHDQRPPTSDQRPVPPTASSSRKRDSRESEIRRVFDFYRRYHPKSHPRPRSTGKEWRAIRARLDEGHTVEDLCMAIDGIHFSPFHQGENDRGKKYDSLELCMRDGSHVQQFIEVADSGPNPVINEKERRGMRAAQGFVQRMDEIEERKKANATQGRETIYDRNGNAL